jgi:uncharacterized membrane protein (DUF485 family)
MSLFQPSRGNASSTTASFQPGHGTVGTAAPPANRASAIGYEAVRASRDFWTIQRRFGSFVRPACIAFIIWYFLYVILAVFAPGFMRISVFGDVNVGICFGVLQFASTFAIAMGYRRWARRRLDPLSARLRNRLEGGPRQ